ncbi:MAG TPA: hypothetical protein VIJ25_01785, partial [Methylococcales bacterium]
MRIIVVACLCAAGFAFMGGCTCQKECPPQIVGEVVFPAPAPSPPQPKAAEDANITASKLGIPVEWLPPKAKEHNW